MNITNEINLLDKPIKDQLIAVEERIIVKQNLFLIFYNIRDVFLAIIIINTMIPQQHS